MSSDLTISGNSWLDCTRLNFLSSLLSKTSIPHHLDSKAIHKMPKSSSHHNLRFPFSAHQNGRAALVAWNSLDDSPPSVAGFVLTCIFIVALLALLYFSVIVGLDVHRRRQRTGLQKRGGRFALELVLGELFMLKMLVVNVFFYGYQAVAKQVMIPHILKTQQSKKQQTKTNNEIGIN
jgi:hypothetical protein